YPSKAPGLDWNAFFKAAGLDTQPVIIAWHPAALAALSKLAASEPLSTWKQWLVFHAVDRLARGLPAAFANERFAFHDQLLTGVPQLAERWKRSVAATNAALGDAVGRLYVARYFPPASKAQVQALVTNLIAAFGDRIDRLDWMSAATKA